MTERAFKKQPLLLLEILSKTAAFLTMLLGIMVLAGWIFNIPVLVSGNPGFVSMKANTALGFILSSLAFYLARPRGRHQSPKTPPLKAFSPLLALFVLILVLATLSQYLFDIDLGIDQFLVKDFSSSVGTSAPGRMALNTGVLFILTVISFSLNLKKGIRIAQVLSLFLILISLTSILGYIYKVPELYGVQGFTEMSLPTALGFILIGITGLFFHPAEGFVAILALDSTGGYIARRLVPFSVGIPIILIAFRLTIERGGIINLDTDVHIVSVLLITIFLGLVGWFLHSLDIMDKKKRRAEQEKETLLREIYHRTNNNMQTIQAMLILQHQKHPDTPLPQFVELLRQRINAMALVHQKLYSSNNLSRLDLGEYLNELAQMVMKSSPAVSGRLQLHTEMCNVPVLFDTAIPIGLVVHELINNTLKYAFPGDREGEVRISLTRDDSEGIELKVSDNGIGFFADFNVKELNTLGLPLVFSMVEDQLKGSISVTTKGGMSYIIRFKDDLYEERV